MAIAVGSGAIGEQLRDVPQRSALDQGYQRMKTRAHRDKTLVRCQLQRCGRYWKSGRSAVPFASISIGLEDK